MIEEIEEVLNSFGDIDDIVIEAMVGILDDMSPTDTLSLKDLSELIYEDTGIKYSVIELQFIIEELVKEELIQFNDDDEIMLI